MPAAPKSAALQPPPAPLLRRAGEVLAQLKTAYPGARTELEYRNPFELLIATVLSAQATDKSVNAATPALFAAYPDAAALGAASSEDVEPLIKSIGLYRTKAKNLVALSALLVERHGGEVPNDFEAVVALPGAGRKTANVVLSNAYGLAAIAVDTHVGRLARRLGFSVQTNPDKVERDLQALFPSEEWVFLHHALILHGRRVCTARAPLCPACTLSALCPKVGLDLVPPEAG
ncbi:endonuclease III [Deinococcus irradiatisoli]|uniref:Endonuclease III n=1 Tax=Deinococcus irradiatisoli TaxID=2202254 RepID=A0A2Z3JDU1_9DEIO|nr:endonuclease III [Deinococcus irradiatisoli]AWN23337.1 endonuclease III [Deinococcus irradiatisoli]